MYLGLGLNISCCRPEMDKAVIREIDMFVDGGREALGNGLWEEGLGRRENEASCIGKGGGEAGQLRLAQ